MRYSSSCRFGKELALHDLSLRAALGSLGVVVLVIAAMLLRETTTSPSPLHRYLVTENVPRH